MRTRTLILVLSLWLASLAVMMLSGCKTHEKTMQRVEVHDTIVKIKTDTAHVYHTRTNTDTLRLMERVEVTRNIMGDTIRVERYIDRWRDRLKVDTLIIYKVNTDSVSVSKDNTSHEKTLKKARLPVYFVCVALFVLGVCIYTIYRK